MSTNSNLPEIQTSTTAFAYAVPTLWDKSLVHDSILKEFWAKFEGKERSNMPIIVKKDLTVTAGKTIKITTKSNLRNAGVSGHTVLEGNEGTLSLGQFEVTVDWIRNAMATDKKSSREIFFNWTMEAKEELAKWLARKKDWDLFNAMLNTATPTILYSNSKTAVNQLDSDCVFSAAEISRIKLALVRQGALPIKTRRDEITGAEEEIYGLVISEVDRYNLTNDPAWILAQRHGRERSSKNPIFTGCLGEYDGVMVYCMKGLAGDAEGFGGSPLRPEATIYGAHANNATTLVVGNDTGVDYTSYFPSTGTLCIQTAAGAIEFATYTGKAVNSFTGVSRGASLGSLTHDGAQVLATGDRITLNNRMSYQIGFGAYAACRAWGQMPQKTEELRDYKFRFGLGIEACFGQAAYQNSAGAFPNFVVNKSFSGLESVSL